MENLIAQLENGISNLSNLEGSLFSVEKLKAPRLEGYGDNPEYYLHNATTKQWLGTVREGYHAAQPIAIFRSLLESGVDLSKTTFKTFKGGARAYFDIPLDPIQFKLGGGKKGDIVEASLRLMMGWDGQTKTSGCIYTRRVWCDNGATKAHTERLIGHKNTKGNQGKTVSLVGELARAAENLTDLKEIYTHLDNVEVDRREVDRYIKHVFALDIAEKDEWTQKKRDNYDTIKMCMDIEMSHAGRTAYTLYQGATRYTNHHATLKGNDRETYLLAGSGYRHNNKAWKTAIEMI